MGLMANRLPQIEKNDRPRCSIDGCNHNAVGGGICRKHGGKQITRKKCSVGGCTKLAQGGGRACILRKKKRCSVNGCNNQAQKGGV